jgi:hypothetical protein
MSYSCIFLSCRLQHFNGPQLVVPTEKYLPLLLRTPLGNNVPEDRVARYDTYRGKCLMSVSNKQSLHAGMYR